MHFQFRKRAQLSISKYITLNNLDLFKSYETSSALGANMYNTQRDV